MNQFRTLLLREWMQHRRGWQVLMAVPLVVLALVAVFGTLHVQVEDLDVGPDAPGPLPMALAAVAGVGMLSLGLAWAASMLQSPGLARRDVQDRSIEFWLSLPTSHSSIASTVRQLGRAGCLSITRNSPISTARCATRNVSNTRYAESSSTSASARWPSNIRSTP